MENFEEKAHSQTVFHLKIIFAKKQKIIEKSICLFWQNHDKLFAR